MSSVFILVPSILNWTHTTPMLSVAVAVSVMLPERVDPSIGEFIVTVGAIVSVLPVPHVPVFVVLEVSEISSRVRDQTCEREFQMVRATVPDGGVTTIPVWVTVVAIGISRRNI